MEVEVATSLLSNIPAKISVAISLLAVGLTWYLNYKKVVVDDKNNFNIIQQQQVVGLMSQIELLSRELQQAREQMANIHSQNIQLMEQLRLSNRRISELEMILDRYKDGFKSV
jgi:predicted nuclease with TOPRIM domain